MSEETIGICIHKEDVSGSGSIGIHIPNMMGVAEIPIKPTIEKLGSDIIDNLYNYDHVSSNSTIAEEFTMSNFVVASSLDGLTNDGIGAKTFVPTINSIVIIQDNGDGNYHFKDYTVNLKGVQKETTSGESQDSLATHVNVMKKEAKAKSNSSTVASTKNASIIITEIDKEKSKDNKDFATANISTNGTENLTLGDTGDGSFRGVAISTKYSSWTVNDALKKSTIKYNGNVYVREFTYGHTDLVLRELYKGSYSGDFNGYKVSSKKNVELNASKTAKISSNDVEIKAKNGIVVDGRSITHKSSNHNIKTRTFTCESRKNTFSGTTMFRGRVTIIS